MSVKQEASGRRSVQVEVEVPGSQEEVWQAIATGPGISSWFVPAEFEVQDGKPVAVTLNFGPGMESSSPVTSWNPPHMFSTEAPGWAPGSPAIKDEWSVEPHGSANCTVRVKHSLSADSDKWDKQLEGTESGWPGYFRILGIYLTHYRGQRSAMMQWMAPAEGTDQEAWQALTAALGFKDPKSGQHWTAGSGVPAIGGMVEYVSQAPASALIRLEKPGPGVASLSAVNFGGQAMVTISLYFYGDQAQQNVAAETPRWQAWIDQHFPSPQEAAG